MEVLIDQILMQIWIVLKVEITFILLLSLLFLNKKKMMQFVNRFQKKNPSWVSNSHLKQTRPYWYHDYIIIYVKK